MTTHHSLFTTHSLFVTGTDTGVGKTVATALLVLRLRAAGVDAGVMKPFASGCECNGGILESEDALWLREVTGVADELELINPIRLEEPLAPLTAAARTGLDTSEWVEQCLAAFAELRRRHEYVVVEGAGGLLAPLLERDGKYFTNAELAATLQLPLLVVARRTLGTINHTMLTCRAALPAPSRCAGVLFCDAEPVDEDDVAASTSPSLIERMTGLTIWGEIPYLEDLSRADLRQAKLQQAALDYVTIPTLSAGRMG